MVYVSRRSIPFYIGAVRWERIAMTKRDQIGVIVLIVLFVVLIVTFIVTSKPAGPAIRPEESVFVQQRIKNLEKNR